MLLGIVIAFGIATSSFLQRELQPLTERASRPGPVKLVLVINLKTAKELQLEVPLSLLIRADELTE